MYLEGAADAEDAVVGVLGRETLEGELDYVVLLGEDIIGPAEQAASAHRSNSGRAQLALCRGCRAGGLAGGAWVPQTELPVASGVAVPLGERLDPALQPRALEDEGSEGRRRHGVWHGSIPVRVRVLRAVAAVQWGCGLQSSGL